MSAAYRLGDRDHYALVMRQDVPGFHVVLMEREGPVGWRAVGTVHRGKLDAPHVALPRCWGWAQQRGIPTAHYPGCDESHWRGLTLGEALP